MDRIKILVIDCQRTIFGASIFPTQNKCLWGNMQTLLDSRIVDDFISETQTQFLTHGRILSMSNGKLHYFMKIKYFSQFCEQLHVNQFSHNFKVNEQIFHQLK